MTTTTMEKNPFVSWGGKDVDTSNKNEFTGVITYRRGNGSRLCEREMFKGASWGCSRYYDMQDQYVGHEWYGKPGYNEKSLAYASKTVSVHTAWVDQTEYQRIYESTVANYEDKKRPKVKYEFKSTGGDWAGLEVTLGPNGKPLVEQEMKGGTPFGCRRFYNEQGTLVGQELYGGVDWACKNGGNHIAMVDTSSKAMRSTPSYLPFLTRFVTQKEFDQVKQEFKGALASEKIVEVPVGSKNLTEKEEARPSSSVKVSRKPKAGEKDEGDSLSTLDSTRSGNEVGKDNQPDPTLALLAKQIAELMERQNLQDEKLEQERMQRVQLEEQLQSERQNREGLELKLSEVDASVVSLKEELKAMKENNNVQAAEKTHAKSNNQHELTQQLQAQEKRIQEQQHLVEETQKQHEEQQTTISNLGAELDEERRQRQVQQTEILKLREEIEQMKDAKQQEKPQQVQQQEPIGNLVAELDEEKRQRQLQQTEINKLQEDIEMMKMAKQNEEPQSEAADTAKVEEIESTQVQLAADNSATETEIEMREPSKEVETEGTNPADAESVETVPAATESPETEGVAPTDAESVETLPTETENVMITTLVGCTETSGAAASEQIEQPSEATENATKDEEEEQEEVPVAPLEPEEVHHDVVAEDVQSQEPEAVEVVSEDPIESEEDPSDQVGSGDNTEEAQMQEPQVVEEVSGAPLETEQEPIDAVGSADNTQEAQSHEGDPQPIDTVGSADSTQEAPSQGGDSQPVRRRAPSLAVEDPKPRPPRQDSKKKKFTWRRPTSFNASFKLPARSKSKENISPPGSANVSLAPSHDDGNMDLDTEFLASGAAPPNEANTAHPEADEQESTAQAEPISEPSTVPVPEDTVTSEPGKEEAEEDVADVVEAEEVVDEDDEEEASISCMEEDNAIDQPDLDGEEAPQDSEDEVASSGLVQDPLPRPHSKKKKGFRGLNKALKNPHASFNASFGKLVF